MRNSKAWILTALVFGPFAWSSAIAMDDVETVIERALKSNLEVKMAEAKVRQAEVELEQVRMKVVEEVMRLISDVKEGEIALRQAKDSLAHTANLAEAGVVQSSEPRVAEGEVIRRDAELERIKMRLEFVQGKNPLGKTISSRLKTTKDGGSESRESVEDHPVVKQLKQARLAVTFVDEPVDKALETILKESTVKVVFAAGIRVAMKDDPSTYTVNLDLAGTRYDLLCAIADSMIGNCVFVVRDYGLLMTQRKLAVSYGAPTIPDRLPMQSSDR